LRKAPRGKEDRHEKLEKSSTYQVGMQVSCCHFTEISQKGALWHSSASDPVSSIIASCEHGDIPEAIAYSMFPISNIPSAKWPLLNRTLMFLAGTQDARGFRQWKKAGRFVEKGSKAFYILDPYSRNRSSFMNWLMWLMKKLMVILKLVKIHCKKSWPSYRLLHFAGWSASTINKVCELHITQYTISDKKISLGVIATSLISS